MCGLLNWVYQSPNTGHFLTNAWEVPRPLTNTEPVRIAYIIEIDGRCYWRISNTPQPPPPPQYTLVWIVVAALALVVRLALWRGWRWPPPVRPIAIWPRRKGPLRTATLDQSGPHTVFAALEA